MTRLVREVLDDPGYALAAKRVQALYAEAAGPGAAADAILDLVAPAARRGAAHTSRVQSAQP